MTSIQIDEVVKELRQRVARRRANGEYPVGLEEQLEAEFRIIMDAVHRGEVSTDSLGGLVRQVESSIYAVASTAPADSRLPGGSVLHEQVGRIVGRHTGQLADGIRTLGVDIARALHEIHNLINIQNSADERQLRDVVSSLMDRVAIIDHLAIAVLNIERRLDQIEASATPIL